MRKKQLFFSEIQWEFFFHFSIERAVFIYEKEIQIEISVLNVRFHLDEKILRNPKFCVYYILLNTPISLAIEC